MLRASDNLMGLHSGFTKGLRVIAPTYTLDDACLREWPIVMSADIRYAGNTVGWPQYNVRVNNSLQQLPREQNACEWRHCTNPSNVLW